MLTLRLFLLVGILSLELFLLEVMLTLELAILGYGGYGTPGYAPYAPPHPPVAPTQMLPTTFAETSQVITCPHCQHKGQTAVTKKAGGMTYLFAGGLCLFGCCLCAWIPFVVDVGKDTEHSCAGCNARLGERKAL